MALFLLLVTSAFAVETRDPAAVEVARRTLQAMGGEQAFAKLRTLKFDFVVLRSGKEGARVHHVWDRWDVRYRVEGLNRDGKNALTTTKPGVRPRSQSLTLADNYTFGPLPVDPVPMPGQKKG